MGSLNFTYEEGVELLAALENRRSVLLSALEFAQRRGDVETVRDLRASRAACSRVALALMLAGAGTRAPHTPTRAPARTSTGA